MSSSRYKPLPPTPGKALPSTPQSPIRRLLPVLISVLLITTVLTLSWHYLFPSSEGQALFSSPETKRKKLQPDLPLVQTTFNHPTPYSKNPPTGENEDLDPWDMFLDGQKGMVQVESPRQYGLPKGFEGDGGEGRDTYRVAAWNQLRCLALIRKAHYTIHPPTPKDLNTSSQPSSSSSSSPSLPPHAPSIHACFDYLRQSIQCSADTTLEWPAAAAAAADGVANGDGWGVEHTCRSWKGVEDWMGGMRAGEEGLEGERMGLGGMEIGG